MVFQESRDSLWFATIVVFLTSNGCNNSSPSFVYHFQKWVQTLPMHWLHCWCWQTLTSLGWNSTINTFPVSNGYQDSTGKAFCLKQGESDHWKASVHVPHPNFPWLVLTMIFIKCYHSGEVWFLTGIHNFFLCCNIIAVQFQCKHEKHAPMFSRG